MGAYATKAFFKKKLKEYLEGGDKFFEVYPAPDCCPICEKRANKKIAVATATEDDYPPFHRECRCSIISLFEDDEAGALAKQKARYASGEFPMKRCSHCKEWTAGNSVVCEKCGVSQQIKGGEGKMNCPGCNTPIPEGKDRCPMCGATMEKIYADLKIIPPKEHPVAAPVYHQTIINPQPQDTISGKACPKCAMAIPFNAKICPYCRQQVGLSLMGKVIVGLFILMVGSCVLGTIGKKSPTSSERVAPQKSAAEIERDREDDQREGLKQICKSVVETTLKAPSSAKWQNVYDFRFVQISGENDMYGIMGYVDAQNSFGAMLRNNFMCKYKKVGKNYEFIDLINQ